MTMRFICAILLLSVFIGGRAEAQTAFKTIHLPIFGEYDKTFQAIIPSDEAVVFPLQLKPPYSQLMVVEATINNIKLNLIIDTESTRNYLTHKGYNKIKKTLCDVSNVNTNLYGQKVSGLRFELGKLRAANMPFYVLQSELSPFHKQYDGIIGKALLNGFRIIFDLEKKRGIIQDSETPDGFEASALRLSIFDTGARCEIACRINGKSFRLGIDTGAVSDHPLCDGLFLSAMPDSSQLLQTIEFDGFSIMNPIAVSSGLGNHLGQPFFIKFCRAFALDIPNKQMVLSFNPKSLESGFAGINSKTATEGIERFISDSTLKRWSQVKVKRFTITDAVHNSVLQPNDWILSINNKAPSGMTLEQLNQILRVPTSMQLRVYRPELRKEITLHLPVVQKIAIYSSRTKEAELE